MGDVIEETQKVISDSINGKKPLSDDKIRTLKNRLKIFRKERDQAQMVGNMNITRDLNFDTICIRCLVSGRGLTMISNCSFSFLNRKSI